MDHGERENGSLRASELLAKHLGMLNQTLTIEEGSQNSAEILEELDALLDSSASESAKSLENNEKMPSDSSVH
jgi:hypothetical protein